MHRSFKEPVRFTRDDKLTQIVANTAAALFFLERRWPADGDGARREAIRVCRQVGAGDAAPEEARRALIRALHKAKFEVW